MRSLTVKHTHDRTRGIILVAAYLVVTSIMTWPFVNYGDLGGSSYGGDQRLIIWTLAWDNHALLTPDSLFQSNIFFPARNSLQYNEHLFAISLFTLPLTAAGASPVLAHRVIWWLAFPLNGVAAFALVYRFTRSRLGAFVGSLVFAFSFYVMLHAHGHLHQIWLWPIPLSLLLLEQWFDAPSSSRLGLWTGTVLLGLLSAWYLAVYVLVANGIFGAVLLLARGEPAAPWIWGRRVTHVAFAAAVLAVCVFPFGRHYQNITSETAEVAAFSADLPAYLVPPENTVLGGWWRANIDNRPRSVYGEQTLYIGWIPLALAGLGLICIIRNTRTDPRAWLFPALVAAGLLLSFGSTLPFIGASRLAPFNWLAALPGLDGIRVPARFAMLVNLGVAGLVGFAVSAFVRRFGMRGSLATALAVPVMLTEWFVVDFPGGRPESHPVPAIYFTPQIQTARSLVSLPEYRGMPDWFLGGDYLYYSTVHWRPIVNGFGRTEPPGHEEVVSTVRGFPTSVPAMRALGIQYVVVHADRLPERGRPMVEAARARTDCRLAVQIGSDYLFEIL